MNNQIAAQPAQPAAEPVADPFMGHEALHTAHLARDFVHNNLIEHSFVAEDPTLLHFAEKAADALRNLYQGVAEKTLYARPKKTESVAAEPVAQISPAGEVRFDEHGQPYGALVNTVWWNRGDPLYTHPKEPVNQQELLLQFAGYLSAAMPELGVVDVAGMSKHVAAFLAAAEAQPFDHFDWIRKAAEAQPAQPVAYETTKLSGKGWVAYHPARGVIHMSEHDGWEVHQVVGGREPALPTQDVPMPTSADQAELMAKLGTMWLEQNAPARLKALATQEEVMRLLTKQNEALVAQLQGHGSEAETRAAFIALQTALAALPKEGA